MLFSLKTILIALFSIFFIACNSSEYIADSEDNNISGVLVDGYISDATICIDLNANGICDSNDSITKSDTNGLFSINNLSLDPDTIFSIIAYGGVDNATQKEFTGVLKTTIDSSKLESDITISPITDIITTTFLNSDNNTSLNLQNIKQIFSNSLDIDPEIVDKDPLKNKQLFIIAQEIEYTKYLLESLFIKNFDLNDSNESIEINFLRDKIKLQILTQELKINQSIIVLESEFHLQIPENEKTFIIEQFDELKRVLTDNTENMLLNITNLNNLQKSIENKHTDIIKKLLDSNNSDLIDIVTIDTDDILLTKNIFYSSDAEFDSQACLETESYNKLSSSNNSTINDNKNGVSITSEYENNSSLLSLYYPNLKFDLSNETTTIFKQNYYFQFDNNWQYNDNRYIYIQTPPDDMGEESCYKFELNSTINNQTDGIKVYRYSEI